MAKFGNLVGFTGSNQVIFWLYHSVPIGLSSDFGYIACFGEIPYFSFGLMGYYP